MKTTLVSHFPFMATFSWSEYYFIPSAEPLSIDVYAAVHASAPNERESIVESVRTAQKATFRKEHNAEFIMFYIFLAGIPLLAIPRVGALIMFFLFFPCLSLWKSYYSHNKALNARCEYLRRELAVAAHSANYAEYLRVRTQ